MKSIITRYTFDASAKTVTLDQLETLNQNQLLAIINQTDNVIIYGQGVPGKGITSSSGLTVTLEYDTTTMSDTDELTIVYEQELDRRVIVGSVQNKFRDGFEGVGGVDTDVWDVANDNSDHIIVNGGNAVGSSYLRLSLNPLVDGSEVKLTSKQTFRMPFRMGFGVSLSQRIVGQELFIGMVGSDDDYVTEYLTPTADIAITGATASITSNVATFTITNHGLKGGDRVTIFGCTEHRLNVGPVIVTPVTVDTFTVPLTLANGTYSTTNGYVRLTDPFQWAENAAGLLFENATVTNASFVTRKSGGKPRILNSTVGTTLATQSNTSPYSDAFNAASNYELFTSVEEVAYRSYPSDALSAVSGSAKWSQGIPDEQKNYKIQIRARNIKGLTRPVARIVSAVKTGTTTATITTDVAHGLVAGDYVQIYGVRDQAATAFPNLTAQTVVATAPTSTTFTIIIGTAATVSSGGGSVIRNEGSVLQPGVVATAIQSIVRTNDVMTVVGSATMAALLPGEYVQLHGLETGVGANAYEGAYKVLKVATTTMELEAPGADFTILNTGGTVIKRTDARLHFVRVLDYTRLITEIYGGRGNTTDINNAVPVSVVSAATVNATTTPAVGSAATMQANAGYGGFLVADVASAAITSTATTAAFTPGVIANIGTYSQSFNVIVTAATGSSPTMDVSVEESMDNGTNWVRVYDFPRITTSGAYTSPIMRSQYGTRFRYVQTVTGSTPSFTRAINRVQFSANAPLIRSFIDRSIVNTTLNSTTPTYTAEGANDFMLAVNMGAITTTAPQFVVEGSEDGSSWYQLSASALTSVASSTVFQYLPNAGWPKFIRAKVAVAGSGSTLGYVALKAVGG